MRNGAMSIKSFRHVASDRHSTTSFNDIASMTSKSPSKKPVKELSVKLGDSHSVRSFRSSRIRPVAQS